MSSSINTMINANGNGSEPEVRPRRRRTLPRPRSGVSRILFFSTGFVLFAVSLFLSTSPLSFTDTLFTLLSVHILILFLTEVFARLIYIIEEYKHLITRYENSRIILFKDVFCFSLSTIVLALCSVFTCIIMYMRFDCPLKLWYNMGFLSTITSLFGAAFLQRNLNLKYGPLYDSLWIESSNGLDYGSGLAHSFFHGYLKLVIPKTGTTEKHLEELMQDYEAEHHVKLEFYKLFVLIPKSLYCPTSLKDDNISPTIEESSSLKEKIITVAGVQNRVYKNSVYKIKSDKGKRVYVCAEYATPLKTFKDVVSFNGEHSNYYQKHKNDIVLQFYLTLQKVLKEHENCTNFCELIFYDDKNESGGYKDVGQILLNRIKKLQSKARAASNF